MGGGWETENITLLRVGWGGGGAWPINNMTPCVDTTGSVGVQWVISIGSVDGQCVVYGPS